MQALIHLYLLSFVSPKLAWFVLALAALVTLPWAVQGAVDAWEWRKVS
jgi:hypothetical protein